MSKVLNIAIGSTCSKPGDVKGNLEQIRKFAMQSKVNGCHMLLTPEMSVTGYGGYDEVLACAEIAGDGPIYQGLAEMASESQTVIMAGFVERNQDKKHIAHYIVYQDGQFVVQRKHRVTPREYPLDPSVRLYFDDTEDIGHVHSGEEQIQYFYINGIRCAVIICADLGIRNLYGILDENGVELLLLPTGAGGTREGKAANEDLNTAEGVEKYLHIADNEYFFPRDGIRSCIAHRRAFAAVNMCGYDGKELYHGGSGSVINQYGIIEAYLAGIENIDHQKPKFVCGEVEFIKR